MVDYIVHYLDTITRRPVTPSVEPGYLEAALPAAAPEDPESWPDIMKDVEEKIMPGMTHWQHPRLKDTNRLTKKAITNGITVF